MNYSTDTIAAISTAVSESGIGIIRISGPEAVTVADRIYRSKGGKTHLKNVSSHTIHYGFIMDGTEMVDEVLVSVMLAPRTFTAEDVVEINCHGGVYAMKRVLETVLKNGARPAEPGEFTKRAFLNGRIDLSRAEAVMDVIEAKNRYALKNSLKGLRGSVQKKISELRGEILEKTAYIESALDDPEHYSLEGFSGELSEKTLVWEKKLRDLIRSFDSGRLIREGISTVIVGKPNAGKSSLLNLLAGNEKAIVTDIAGTTRDVITETINIGEITLNVADTAGIRDTDDKVEKIGVDRALAAVKDADLIIYVVDSSTKFDLNDQKISSMIIGKKAIILLNKIDLKTEADIPLLRQMNPGVPVIPVSVLDGSGMGEFEKTLKDMFYAGAITSDEEVFITNARQKSLLEKALDSLTKVDESIKNSMPEDFFSIDLMDAYEALGEITGEQVNEDLVNEIFSKFCMGK